MRRITRFTLARSARTNAASMFTKRLHPSVQPPHRKPRAAGAAEGGGGGYGYGYGYGYGKSASTGAPFRFQRDARTGLFGVPSARAEKRSDCSGLGQWNMPKHRHLTCCGCLSGARKREASSAAPLQARASQVARSEAKGHGQRGRLFFAYFLLAKQKKVSRPPGRNPGRRRLQKASLWKCTSRKPLTPTLSPKGRGSKAPTHPPPAGEGKSQICSACPSALSAASCTASPSVGCA